MKFEQPLWFALLLLLPFLIFWKRRNRKGILYPSLLSLPSRSSGRIRFFFIRDLLIYLALAGFVLAAAGPYRLMGEEKSYAKGYLLQLVVDRSGSMGSLMDKEGKTNRLDIVKSVVHDFIRGNGSSLPGREGDRIGLISFALFADTMAPLTVSHDIVLELVDSLSLASREEDGTSMGDALALAVARNLAWQKRSGASLAGSVIILLTDGQNNSGKTEPLQAAELAARYQIKVYTIGFGGGYYKNAFGQIQKIPSGYGLDGETLSRIAQITGGQYFNAEDEQSLVKVYKTIDALEKQDMEQIHSRNKDLLFPFVLSASLVMLFAAVLVRNLLLNVVEEE